MSKTSSILIVGGGIGGMSTALALAKRGIASTVLEQAPQFREAGAGIQFCPNTFKILNHLGMTKAFTAIANFPKYLCYVDGLIDFEFVRLPLGQQIVDRFQHPFGSFHREEVLREFVKACKSSPLIKLVTSAKVIHVEERDDIVLAKTDAGDIFEGEILIGCDGIGSVVRKFVLGDERPRDSGQIIYRGVVHKNDMPPNLELESIVHFVRPNAHVVHYPIGNNDYFNISAIFQKGTPDDSDELDTWFAGSIPKVMDLIHKVSPAMRWSLCDRQPISQWSKGRIVLLGDSVHPTLPYLTSGAGMAVEDAVVLSNKIAQYSSNFSQAFKEYQEERYLRTAYVQLFSRAYGDVHHSSGVARELRNDLISKRSVEENLNWVSYLYSGIDLD